MKKAYLKALSLCLLLIFCIGAVTATEERTMQVPCLTVSGGTEGNISHLPFTFSIGHSDRPLRILIGDDTPGGSGNKIRNSVWLAATTAALQRKISLQGVKIEVEFSGSVDGPSAGAVFCLAIMSAIDGRQFPSDFAMTGTIMPDGTVGAVGGIPAKIRAAAKQGKKRFCIPAVDRFERFNGENVDLFRLGKELGVEIFPVDNINEAYCYMHKLPQPVKPNLNARDLCRLNEKTEDVILEQCKLFNKQTDEFAKKLPDHLQKILNHLFSDPENTIEDLLKQGAFLPLYEHLSERYILAKSYVAFNTFLEETRKRYPILMEEKLNAEDLPKYRDALFSLYQRQTEDLSESEQKTADQSEKKAEKKSPQNTPLVLAQMYPWDTFCELWTLLIDKPRWTDRKDLDSLPAEELIAAKELFIEMWVYQSISGIFLKDDLLGKSREQVVLTMPPMKENRSVKAVENLLFQSTISTRNALDGVLTGTKKDSFATPNGKTFYFSFSGAESAHTNKDEVIVSILFQIEAFTRGQALLIKYGPDLGTQCNDDGSFSYGNTAFLSYLIRTARENALLRISECKAQGVPCLAAINYFQQAELARDDDGVDKLHDVLENYWRASLLAEALQMCFQK